MVWVGRDLKDYLNSKPPCCGQGHLLDQVAQSPIQPGLKKFQGWGKCENEECGFFSLNGVKEVEPSSECLELNDLRRSLTGFSVTVLGEGLAQLSADVIHSKPQSLCHAKVPMCSTPVQQYYAKQMQITTAVP